MGHSFFSFIFFLSCHGASIYIQNVHVWFQGNRKHFFLFVNFSDACN